MRIKKAIIPLGLGLLVVGAFAYRSFAPAKKAPGLTAANSAKVSKGDLVVTVIETGTVDAAKTVELKSRVSGRLARLLVEEGDFVRQGQVVAVIDPQETELVVRQNAAQLRGAQSAVQRASLEIGQRRVTAQAAYEQAKARLAQLTLELQAQPKLTTASIRSAETALNTARQEKTRLLTSAHPTQLKDAESSLQEAVANADNAEREYRRQADLEGKGYVAGRAVESAKLALDLAAVRRENASDGLAKLRQQQRIELTKADEAIRSAESDLARARANAYQDQSKVQEVASARAEVMKAKAALTDAAILAKGREQNAATVDQLGSALSDSMRQLRETEVRSPISGVVTKKLLEVGELATGLSGFSAGTPIVRIEDRRAMRVKLDVNEIDVARLSVGQESSIEVDALPNESLKGIVTKISPASNQLSQGQATDGVVRYLVEVQLERPSPKLRSGMSAKCTMDVLRRNGVLTLPIEFVTKKERRNYVQLVSKPGAKPKEIEIQVGAATGAKVEVVSGAKEGDIVAKPTFTGPKRQGMMQGPGDE